MQRIFNLVRINLVKKLAEGEKKMRIDKIVDAPREFIFEKIIDSCLFDIEKNTGKRPKVRSLNGYEYSKSFGKNQRGSIKIS